MEPSLEIYNFLTHIKEKSELIKILEYRESWLSLIAIMPKIVKNNDFNCDLNQLAYNSQHISQIRLLSTKTRTKCSEILLNDFSEPLDGDFPQLGHLLDLLIKAELFQAAEYVAVKLLKQQPPKRPNKGPLAPILLNENENKITDLKTTEIERILDEINYPSSAIQSIKQLNSIERNLNYTNNIKTVPKIIVSEFVEDALLPPPHITVTRTPEVPDNSRENNEISDLIQFSKTQEFCCSERQLSNDNVPNLSELLNNDNTSANLDEIQQNLPNLSFINTDSSNNSSEYNSSQQNIPVLSALISQNDNNKDSQQSSTNSGSFQVSGQNMPVLSELMQPTNTPALSSLLLSNKTETTGNSLKNSRQCSSPLPNLSLNTVLPHFTYTELEFATDNFNEIDVKMKGRFLGSGSYGKVYLGLGLLERPVAVKRLNLNNTDVVLDDDAITKQFRNEVEVLCKYKHDNLLSLLGYSCDGPTYCLLYEYIPGGALKDRLQKPEKLLWTERLYIALGTAKAISYLHTAFSTPLIHRDIKSANILLDLTNKPKLGDFGLIKLLPNQNATTGTTIWGTTVYMAPEALRGVISVKVDTFSFGVVLLELLTSLPLVDENRENVDLLIHVEDKCQDSIAPLLDTSVGSWKINGIDIAEHLYEIAKQCLENVKRRPKMDEVTNKLNSLVQQCA